MARSILILGLTISTLFFLSACAVDPADSHGRDLPTDAEVEQYNASVDPDERIVCRQEARVGTNIPHRVCRLARHVEEDSDFHREQLRQALR